MNIHATDVVVAVAIGDDDDVLRALEHERSLLSCEREHVEFSPRLTMRRLHYSRHH